MDFTKVETAILVHIYRYGDDRPINIAESQGVHRNSVSRTANDLIERGFIENKGHGVYKLTADGEEVAHHLSEISEDSGESGSSDGNNDEVNED